MKREPGFYWVKWHQVWHGPPMRLIPVWIVCEWKFGRWRIPGEIADFDDTYFNQIDERKLNSPE